MPKATPIFKGTSHSVEETINIAGQFAKDVRPGDIIFLQGDLGAGKTVFMKGLGKALGVNPKAVSSPTFVLMNIYNGTMPIYHFDLYRLEKEEELDSVHFDEFFYGEGISVIEWPERLGKRAPDNHWLIKIDHKEESTRAITITRKK